MMHKIYLNVAPINIYSMFTIVDNNNRNPRREPAYFNVPYFRLKSTDKTLSYKGPIIYNDFINKLNKKLPRDVTSLQNKFMNPFKTVVSKHLLQIQSEGGMTWEDQNFILYI